MAIFLERRGALHIRREPLVGFICTNEGLTLGACTMFRRKLLGHKAQKFIRCGRRVIRVVKVKEKVAISKSNKHIRCNVLKNLTLHILCRILTVVRRNGSQECIRLEPSAILNANAEKTASAFLQIHHSSVLFHKFLLCLIEVLLHLEREKADLGAPTFDFKRKLIGS